MINFTQNTVGYQGPAIGVFNASKLSRIILLLLVFFSFSGCGKKDKKEIEADYLSTYIMGLDLAPDYKWVVVLPGMGCHGCIQEGEAFIKENVTNKKIFFVLTNIESLKLLQNKIGVRIKEHSNVFADVDNNVKIPSDNRIYPCIIKLENAEMTTHEFQSPANSAAFNNLKARLKAGL